MRERAGGREVVVVKEVKEEDARRWRKGSRPARYKPACFAALDAIRGGREGLLRIQCTRRTLHTQGVHATMCAHTHRVQREREREREIGREIEEEEEEEEEEVLLTVYNK